VASAEFATLLRAWRRRRTPADAGMPPGSGRRIAGLRRAELATLADLSTDYIVRLEQGRAEHPSEGTVAALAEALQLSEPERAQLYAAAGLPPPLPARIPTDVPESVRSLVERAPGVAVAVYTLHWDLLETNAAWEALLGAATDRSRNLVVQQFSGAGVPVLRDDADTERFERALICDLRAAAIRYPDDPSLRALLAELTTTSARFRQLWQDGTVAEHRNGPKTFAHPLAGPITVTCDAFLVAGADLHVVTYTAATGSADELRFAELIQSGR
jgi:transcriptional regulator with XRE-family HTH domain